MMPHCCLQVEASQSMIRIVGLSATLPNYKDVASFLGVTDSGLFYFDASYRPVPLAMQFIGATDKNILASKNVMDEVAFQKVGAAMLQMPDEYSHGQLSYTHQLGSPQVSVYRMGLCLPFYP